MGVLSATRGTVRVLHMIATVPISPLLRGTDPAMQTKHCGSESENSYWNNSYNKE